MVRELRSSANDFSFTILLFRNYYFFIMLESNSDLIVEAIVEKERVKLDFYTTLGPLIKPTAIFASNTSSLAITPMSNGSSRL